MNEEMFEEIGCEEIDWTAHEDNAFRVQIDHDDSVIDDFESLVDQS